MTELLCPTCYTKLLEHEAGPCLDEWVTRTILPHSRIIFPYSTLHQYAWDLMQKVWEMDPSAAITRDAIVLEKYRNSKGGGCDIITGHTFPLRVCKAALWLSK